MAGLCQVDVARVRTSTEYRDVTAPVSAGTVREERHNRPGGGGGSCAPNASLARAL